MRKKKQTDKKHIIYVERMHGSFNLGYWIRFHCYNANSNLVLKVSLIPFPWSGSKLHLLFRSSGSEKERPSKRGCTTSTDWDDQKRSAGGSRGGCVEWIQKIPFIPILLLGDSNKSRLVFR